MGGALLTSTMPVAAFSAMIVGAALLLMPRIFAPPTAAIYGYGLSTVFRNRVHIGIALVLMGLLLLSSSLLEAVLLAAGMLAVRVDLVFGGGYGRKAKDNAAITSYISPKLKNRQIGNKTLNRIEACRPLWLVAIMPFFLFGFGGGNLVPLGLLLFLALWVAGSVGTDRWGAKGLPYVPLILLVGLVPVTLVVGMDSSLALEHIGLYMSQWLAFFAMASWVWNSGRVGQLAWCGVGAGAVLAVLSPLLIAHSLSASSGLLVELSVQKNVLAGTVAPFVPLTLCLFLMHLRGSKRVLPLATSVVLLLAMTLGVVFSGSRGASLALIVGVAVVGVAVWRPMRYVAAVGTAACVIFLPLGGLDLLLGTDGGSDVTVRTEIWSRALQVIRDFPLTGLGLGQFQMAVPKLYPFLISDPEKVHHAHNLYLQVASDLGLPGLAAFLALIFSCLWLMRGAWTGSNSQPSVAGWVSLGCLGAVTVVLVHGLLDAVTWTTKPAFLVWMLLGLGVGAALTAQATRRASEEYISL